MTYLKEIEQEGIERYFHKARSSKLSSTPPGSLMLSTLLATTVDRLWAYKKGLRKAETKNILLDKLGAKSKKGLERFSLVACRTILDNVGRNLTASRMSGEIGINLQDELYASRVKKASSLAWRKMEERYAGQPVYFFRGALQNLGRNAGVKAEFFTRKERQLLGALFLEAVELGGAIVRNRRKLPNGYIVHLIQASEDLERFLEVGHSAYSTLSPKWRVSGTCPDWEPTSKLQDCPDKTPLRKLQEQPWEFADAVYQVILEIYRLGESPLLPSQEDLPIPEKPEDIATNEDSLKDYKIAAYWTYKRNIAEKGKRLTWLRTLGALREAQKVAKEFGRFYIPVQADFRGRAHYSPVQVSPQGPDISKACLLLGDCAGETVDPDWVNAALLKAYGEGLSEEIISAVRENPVGSRNLWETADNPWEFLKLCLYREDPRLPLSLDARNHGLQLVAALQREPEALLLTNVAGTEKRDIYTEIGEEVLSGLSRETWKHPIMTLAYGASSQRWVWHLYEQPELNGLRFSAYWGIARDLQKVLAKRLPWAIAALDFFKDTGKKATGPIQWRTPAGFTVRQSYKVTQTKKVRSTLFGSARVSAYAVPTGKPDTREAAKAFLPNYVQSLDASILHILVRDWEGPIGTAHDRFFTTSGRLSELQDNLERVAGEVLNSPLLQNLKEDLGIPHSEGLPLPADKTHIEISPHMYGL